jgi:hypothetical protein
MKPPTANSVTVFDEPSILFAGGHSAVNPQDGLSLFGPYSPDGPPPTITPVYVTIGCKEGLSLIQDWSGAMNCPWSAADARKHRLWPPFPGYDVAFGIPWPKTAAASFEIDRDQLLVASRRKDSHERCYSVVEMFLDIFEKAKKKVDGPIGVAICVIPDEVWANCRPKSVIANPSDDGISAAEKDDRRRGQGSLFEEFDPKLAEIYKLAPDFRRQLKARSMRFDIPLQIVRESTLRLSDEKVFGQRGLTPISDRMWNLSSVLYYKCGGKPWKLNTARDGVCYIGLAFRRSEDTGRTACCAAQMFLDSGDGIVFLGEFGPWYAPESKQFHLTKNAAKNLLTGVLKTYHDLEGKPLKEIFLHSRSDIDLEEFAGYKEACPEGCKVVGVRVRTDRNGPRLFRLGTMPVIRGTFWKWNERSGYLYASGFKPRLATYDGWETPAPLRIDIQHGEAPIERVAMDILGLTKLNYNACKLGESKPVTVKFSDNVGEILVSNPTVTDLRCNFKYYI